MFKLHPCSLAVMMATSAMVSMASNANVMEEIVVTAAKRAQTLQEIPIAVSVTSADTIAKAAITDIGDLQAVVPTLRVHQLQSSANTGFAIRGFGNGTNDVGIEPSVGIFIDGVYRSRAGAAISDLPRVERIEVLSGPQSTLFGKNASAGVVSVITPKPSGETGGYIAGGLSNYSGKNLKGLFESAVSDDLSFDVSANWNQRDGYFDNSFDGSQQNERDRWGVRGQVYYTPTENVAIRVIADYDEIDEVCCGTTNLLNGPTGAAITAIGGQYVPDAPFSRDAYLDVEPFNEIENSGISVHVDVDYDTFTLTSITSYRTSDVAKNVDVDYSSAEIISGGNQGLGLDTFTQEIRLTSNTDGDFEWMVGGFFFDESLDFNDEVIWGDVARDYATSVIVGLGGPANTLDLLELIEPTIGAGESFAEGTGVREKFTQENQAISFFGQTDWHINEGLTLTFGLNYTQDEKELTFEQENSDTFAGLDLTTIAGGALSTLAPLQFLEPRVGYPNSVENGKTDDSDTTYTLRLAYDLTDNINIYGSTATGFKASSWNITRDSSPFPADIAALDAAGLTSHAPNLSAGTRFASPEEATVFELGLKASFERGSLNVAVFDQTIEGFQSALFKGTGFELSNAGEQSTQGIEFDAVYYPIDSLKLTLSGMFLDPIYDSYTEGRDENGPADLSGAKPAGIHEVSLATSITYEFDLAGNEAYVRGDYQFEDEVKVVDNVAAELASREVKQLNLGAGMTTPDGLSVNIWVKNATDENYLISAFPLPAQDGSFNGYPNQPRTFGVGFQQNF